MLYKRSSFIKFLIDVKDCEVNPIKDGKVLQIKNHMVTAYLWVDKNDRIDYNEIWVLCTKLYIDGLPTDRELEKAD